MPVTMDLGGALAEPPSNEAVDLRYVGEVQMRGARPQRALGGRDRGGQPLAVRQRDQAVLGAVDHERRCADVLHALFTTLIRWRLYRVSTIR
jgi:hypothetical protein